MIISPSLLSADFSNLKKEIADIEATKAAWLHYDVMDGHFVPNISFGYSILADVRKVTSLVLDVHLMISDPLAYLDQFIKAGADYITFHYEAYEDKAKIQKTIGAIKAAGKKAGLSIKPGTDVSVILPYLKDLDLVLVMSVEPGFGGQSFMESSLAKISFLKAEIEKNNYPCIVEVDGGINDKTMMLVKEAGVDAVVAGSYIFGKADRKAAVDALL